MIPAKPALTDYASATEYLYALKALGSRYGIDRMRLLVEAIGHPERCYPVLHVTGTNGKGSVAAMLDAILRAAGWSTGLYTSPHLVKLGERVQVNRELLGEAEIVSYTNELRPIAERLGAFNRDDHPSFFEFMTAMAFLQFVRRRVDLAVIEVGLGGRLDATNVVLPEVSVITSISLDHTEMLGDTLARIAREKAGIIKPDRPVVVGRMPAEAEFAIREAAVRTGSPVLSVREVYGEELADYPPTSLEGDYQRWNAATATLVVRTLPPRWGLTEEVITRGLQQVNWPGRWQRITIGGRPLILDASHNPEGAQVLENNLHKLVAATGRHPIVVTGVLGAFRARPLLNVICRYAREIYLVPPHQARACSYEELEALAPADARPKLHRASLAEIFPSGQTCALGGPEDTVVVTGSIYLLGEVLERIQPDGGAAEGRLQDF
ncbi:MAG: bifunctional folylpolyglutamate synthase/dihydrofolate synthase [Opitutaceae bacterium]|nr:bifunctional folylpolyglutamate synthase/dihydrofolate synthase [Opitutaceae bacterium]